MSFEVGFCKLLNVYFNDVQINRWLHLSTNFWRIPSHYDLLGERVDQINFTLRQQPTGFYQLFDGP